MNFHFCFVRVAATGLLLASTSLWAQSTAFTYQGELTDATGPVTGTCDFTFDLYAAATGGSALATQTVNGVTVTNGLFTTQIDFGGAVAFDGNDRYLGVTVNCGSGPSTLAQRQPLSPSPYAITSYSTEALQGTPVSATPPTSGQVLSFDGSEWAPATAAGGDVTDVNVESGSGLISNNSGGPVVSLDTDPSVLQQRVSGTCAGGDKVISVNADGTVACGPDANSGGDVTAVTGGNFLTTTGNTGNVTVDLDALGCPAGEYIEAINSDGTVTCTPAPSISSYDIVSASCEIADTGGNDTGQCSVDAICPSGSQVIGGGAGINCMNARVVGSFPNESLPGWRAVGRRPAGLGCGANPTEVTAYAICADLPD